MWWQHCNPHLNQSLNRRYHLPILVVDMGLLDAYSSHLQRIRCWLWECKIEGGVTIRLLLGEDYTRIHETLLGTKDTQQLRNRSKNQRNSKNQRMNIHKRYFSIYSEFKKWDPSVYTRICQLILTHGRNKLGAWWIVTSWQVLQRLYFYFYNEISLKYYWLNRYFNNVAMMLNTTQSDEIPFFLITPVRTTIQVGTEEWNEK